MKPTLHLLLLLVLTFGLNFAHSQVVFSDDFSDNTDPAWTATGNLSGSAWDVFRSGVDWGARRNDSPIQLELINDISATANVGGYCLVTTSALSFSSPYATTLINGGAVTWTFNMRQIRGEPSGFSGTNYGVAYILAGQTSTDNSTGSGYAVVLGGPGSSDSLRLVRYNGGLNADSDLTNLIKSNTSGLTDIGADYLSVKVTYNPCNGGQWEFFARNDGLTEFADPLTGTLVSQGTVNDNTYTGMALDMMAAYWKGSTTAAQTAFFNNVTVSVIGLPAANFGANPSVCSGITTANLTYTGLTGGANQYTIDWNGAAEAQGFTDLPLTSLPASPIVVTIPGGAVPATYYGDLILINSTTLCESVLYPISVLINPLPVVGCPNDTTLCSNEPAYTLGGGTPSGGTYSGTGVSAGMFDPDMASPGVNVITYSYTDVNTCSNTCTFDITVNTAPVAVAGSYGPACEDDPDIMLNGTPSGGTWTGSGVSGNTFDPSFGTETLTYTYTAMNGCTDSDQTTIVVSSCLDPSTMRWVLLENNVDSDGPCISSSDCNLDTLCYGLEYTPLFTGNLTSYTTGFFMDCNNGANPVLSNESCVMNNNSPTQNFCATADSVLFNSSGNSGGLPVTSGIPVILHQVCFSIPSTGVMIITKDNTLGLSASIDSLGAGGFETDNVQFYTPYSVDSATDCAILPLTWLDFTAKADGDLISQLDWSTADEINNSHFEIQRAAGGGNVFETIGRVEADVEALPVHHYVYTDHHARPGKNYYRIRQVDYDGRYRYSPLRTVTFTATKFAVDMWPNPARETVTVYIRQADIAGQMMLVDLSGRVVHTQRFEAGGAAHELPVDHFDSGIYTLVVTSGENRNVQKLVIIE